MKPTAKMIKRLYCWAMSEDGVKFALALQFAAAFILAAIALLILLKRLVELAG